MPLLSYAQGKVTRPIRNNTHTSINTTVHQEPTTGTAYGHDWVDLGLPSGTLWATCNVGAIKSNECGDYYSWGAITSPKDSKYSAKNSLTHDKDVEQFSGNPQYDVARALWGGEWRIPTEEEYEELIELCKFEIKQIDGVSGAVITGTNGNSIFIPYTPIKVETTTCNDVTNRILLWLATPMSSGLGYVIAAKESGFTPRYSAPKYSGHPIRPVISRSKIENK